MVAAARKGDTYSSETLYEAVARGGDTAGHTISHLRLFLMCAWLGTHITPSVAADSHETIMARRTARVGLGRKARETMASDEETHSSEE